MADSRLRARRAVRAKGTVLGHDRMYSLGRRSTTCYRPHAREATDRVAEDNLKSPCELNHKVSQKTSDAVMWAMQMDPKLRPQSARDFINVLVSETPITIPLTVPVTSAPTVAVPGILSVEQPKIESPGKRKLLAIILVISAVVIIGDCLFQVFCRNGSRMIRRPQLQHLIPA